MSKKSRHRPRIMQVNEYGDMTEQNIVRERAKEAAKQKAQDRKNMAAERRNRGKDARTNYLDMDGVEFSTMRQGD